MYNVRHNITMLITNRGIVIIMTNPQKTQSFNNEVMYICPKNKTLKP